MKVKRWSRSASIAFSLLFIAIMCFTLLPSPVQIGPLSFGGAGVAGATPTTYQVSFTGNATWTVPAGLTTIDEVIVVAGGGGGGYGTGGGGGAGGFVYNAAYVLSDAEKASGVTVTIGAGGAAGTGWVNPGTAGGNSVFGTITAAGGGVGAPNGDTGGSGGSGGGGGGNLGAKGTENQTPDQGCDGGAGAGATKFGAGGGGGCYAPGTNGSTTAGGSGGSGCNYPQFTGVGSPEGWFAGGGGGGSLSGTDGYGAWGGGGTSGGASINGIANTGGGGAGAHDNSSNAGAGGSGIIVIRYTISTPTITTNSATSILTTSAILNGNVTSSGTGNVTTIGFGWGLTSVTPAPGNVTPANSGYANYCSNVETHATGSPFHYDIPVGNLTPCTNYYFNAGAANTYGWAWGTEMIFTTTGCGDLFLSGYDSRIKTVTTSSSAITGDAEMLEAFYSGVAIESDSICQFLYRPAARYKGTYDRTYIAGTNSNGLISIKQWDETTLTLSDPVTLWDFATNPTDDHQGCSVIVLQHQTGNLSTENGTILVAVGANPTHYLGTRRSNNAEDITSWGTAVIAKNDHEGWYPQLTETSDGTIRLFSQDNVADTVWLTEYRTLTLNANPSTDTWSAPTVLFTRGAGYNTYAKPWVDGADIHFGFGSLIGGSSYENIWYIKYQGNDTTWRAADGTARTLPLDMSNAAHTPDIVYTGTVAMMWDTKTDAMHNPYLLWYLSPWSYDGDIYRSYYSAGWQNVDTGINIHGIDASNLMSGAQLKESNVDVIYAGVPHDAGNYTQIEAYEKLGNGTWQLADGTNGTTVIAEDGRITQNSPGWNFRPVTVLNGAGHFEILWFYSERYNGTSDWESMRMAYPGFSNQNFLCLNKISRTDFGDLRLTLGDGSTLQPSTSSGVPWIQEKTDSWRAILWWKIGSVPVSPSTLTNYVYYGNSTNTNANTQAIMDAQFLACDHFDSGSSPDTNKWTVYDTMSVASSNLELTSTSGTRSFVSQNAANYPLFLYGEIRMRLKCEDSTPGAYTSLGLAANSNEQNFIMPSDTNNTADRVALFTVGNTVISYDKVESQDLVNWHTWKIDWKQNNTYFYNDLNSETIRTIPILQKTFTGNTSYVAQGLSATEGATASAGITYIDWMFARPYPNATTLALTQEFPDISNTPASKAFGIVQPSQTYWANGAEPDPWPLEAADCWGNLTNNSSFAVDLSASMTNMIGGTTWTIGSSPDTNIFTIKIGVAGKANVGNFTILSSTPVVWITNMAAGNMTRWTMVFYTPTNAPQFADGTPKSGNMTFEAEAS